MSVISTSTHQGVGVNKTLVQVYKLLAMNMATSALAALACMSIGISPMTALMMTIGAFILLFVIGKKANSASGVALTFLFTGLLGGSLGSTLSYYVALENGSTLIFQALGMTAIVFGALSGYVISRPNKDFSSMGTFLFVGLIVLLVAIVANIFMQIPALTVAISAAGALLMSGFIVYDTNKIIREQPNYILATVSMYLNVFNLFTFILSFLHSTDD